jgi:aspartyl/asparaginyl beta-hydroxylase (cupin superfamily)
MGDDTAITYEDWLELLEEVIEQACRDLHVERSIAGRLERGLAAGAANVNRPYGAQYPGILYPDLPSEPWPAKAMYPWIATLEAASTKIDSELHAIVAGSAFSAHPEQDKLADVGEWSEFRMLSRGRRFEENLSRCPITAAVLKSIPGADTAGSVFFSRLAAGSHIIPHCGPHNLRIRAHLGLIVPDGACQMRVGTETRCWTAGEVLLFDDSFEHEVWNHTPFDRCVLIVDVWHRGLSRDEITLFREIDRRLSASIPSYAISGDIPARRGSSARLAPVFGC